MRRTTHYVALVSMIATSMIVWSILSYGPPVLGQAEALKIGFFGSYKVTADKMDPSKLPIIGACRWRGHLRESPGSEWQG